MVDFRVLLIFSQGPELGCSCPAAFPQDSWHPAPSDDLVLRPEQSWTVPEEEATVSGKILLPQPTKGS